MANPRFEIGRVEFILLWVWGEDGDSPKHKYEVTLAHFPDRVEVIRVGDVATGARVIHHDRNSSDWFRVMGLLQSEGLLEVK